MIFMGKSMVSGFDCPNQSIEMNSDLKSHNYGTLMVTK